MSADNKKSQQKCRVNASLNDKHASSCQASPVAGPSGASADHSIAIEDGWQFVAPVFCVLSQVKIAYLIAAYLSIFTHHSFMCHK